VAATAPLPASGIERWYSLAIYPALQRILTTISNLVPFALFDVLWIGAVAALVVVARRRIRSAGWAKGALRLAVDLARAAAIVYLMFLATWGLNYRRVAMFEKIAFEPSRITPTANATLGEWALSELNTDYAAAHTAPIALDRLRG